MSGGTGAPARQSPAKRGRLLALVLVVALGAAAAGWLAGQTIQSPQEAAQDAAPPPAAPITVPVELRVLESSVVTRGEVRFAQAVEVEIAPDLGSDLTTGTPVVTGRVPDAGDELAEGDILLEASGRPVFLLAGELPMYRTLRPGMSGADVAQLETALSRLGHFHATPDDTYGRGTAAAVRRLYESGGYEPASLPAEQEQQLAAAREAVELAETGKRQAELAFAQAAAPPPRSAVLAAEGAVAAAELAHDQAIAAYEEAVADGADTATFADLESQVLMARNQLAVAEAQLEELTAPPDTSVEREGLADAEKNLEAAKQELARLEATAGPRVPRGEVVFVPSLPRRVDQVEVTLGDPLGGTAMTLTGTDVRVAATVSRTEVGLIEVGMAVRLDDEISGVDVDGTVESVAGAPGTGGAEAGRYAVVVAPEVVDPTGLAGLNLRVTIPIESTDGQVRTVPLAALVTDASGATEVRVARGDRFEDVPVTVGLGAEGFVEVTPVAGQLAAGDLVVVGQQR